MSALGLKIIDESVQSANDWINDLDRRTGWENKPRSYRLLRAVLHVLRDHLGVDEAAQLAAQLPIFIRGVYYEGWNPSKTPVTLRSPEAVIDRVQNDFAPDPMGDAPEAIAAVIALLHDRVSAGEMDDVVQGFTKQIRRMF